MESIIKPKIPISKKWIKSQKDTSMFSLGYESFGYFHPMGFYVISALEVATDNGVSKGPEYHISISKNGNRCTSNEAKWVCKQFGMIDAIEDNHTPGGIARSFWLPVAEKYIGEECKCVNEENAIVEDNGDYIWRT